MDRHIPLHCFRKHCAGAGIHAQEILEKFIRDPIADGTKLLEQIKILKSIPCVLEEAVLRYDAGTSTLPEYISELLQLMDEIRKMRQEALTWIPAVRMASQDDHFETWQKDFIQEINEYAGELWQMEKHLSEYIADIYVKETRHGDERALKEIGKKIASILSATNS